MQVDRILSIEETAMFSKRLKIIVLASMIMFVMVGFIFVVIRKMPNQEEVKSTQEETLTKIYGNSVSSIIKHYYLTSDSLESYQNPATLSDVVTGKLLEYFLNSSTKSSTYLVAKSVDIKAVHVLEYTSTRIKTIACGNLLYDRMTSSGSYIESVRPIYFNSVSVFLKENETWKLAAQFDFSDPTATPLEMKGLEQWEKDYIGDLQSYVRNYSSCGS